jgi:hypothetical protein
MSSTASFAAAFALLSFVVPVCADEPKSEPKPDQPKRLSTDELGERLVKHLRKLNPDMKIDLGFGYKETTTDEVWNRLHVQVVKVTGDVMRNHSFVIRKDDVFGIGQAFGGQGVTTFVVKVGTLEFEKKDKDFVLKIRLDDKIPDDIKDKLK